MNQVAEVLDWDVLDGDVLGAVVRCRMCPCRAGTGCDGTGELHRPYRMPGGETLDFYRDAEKLIRLLDDEHPIPADYLTEEDT